MLDYTMKNIQQMVDNFFFVKVKSMVKQDAMPTPAKHFAEKMETEHDNH